MEVRFSLRLALFVAAATIAACSGTSGTGLSPMQSMHATPTPIPTITPGPNGVLVVALFFSGPAFINQNGLTVYIFDADLARPGHSVCNDACAANWPPVAPPTGVQLQNPWSSIIRDDASMQLAYAGRPLYTFAGDMNFGSTLGDGQNAFGGVWHVARPQSSASPSPSPMSTPTPY